MDRSGHSFFVLFRVLVLVSIRGAHVSRQKTIHELTRKGGHESTQKSCPLREFLTSWHDTGLQKRGWAVFLNHALIAEWVASATDLAAVRN